ncbi:MAG: AMP-binding protein [Deltaproteobacteria bacterium]|nr:AMP-binding protein [Deltaproteobacteria bacterium]
MHPGTHAAIDPNRPAYVMAPAGATGETVTYGALDAASNRFAHALRRFGLAFRDGIAVCMENSARYYEAVWGAQRSGLYYTAVSTRLTPGELEYLLNDCGAKVFVTSKALAPLAEAVRDRIPNVTRKLMTDGTIPGYASFEATIAAEPATPVADEREGTDLLYSSGTTGRPKGVKFPLRGDPLGTPNALLALVTGLYAMGPETRYLSPAPLYHAAPLRFNLAVQRLGGTSVIMEHFDAEEFLRLIERHRITHTQVVPTMFVRLLKLPEEVRRRYDVSSLTHAIHAAAPCPIPVKEQMIAWWGPIIHEYYGGTEGNGLCALNSTEWLAHKGSVGRPLLGTIRILDDDGAELPPGEAGSIYFAGGNSFEYLHDEEKTRASRRPDGASTLGDIGYVDADGYLYLTDRKANMIISGGVNIYPQEAENLLVTHPKVQDVAVFGVPNEDFGEEVKAVVQPVDMAGAGPALAEELMAFCRQHLSHVKCPRSIDFEAELPRHPTGKLYKRLLKDRYWQGHASRIL